MKTTLCVLAVVACAVPACADGESVLEYGCRGGVTGGGDGVVVRSDGRISRWTMERPGAPRQETTVADDPDGATRLFALLKELNFEAIDFQHPKGNMSCSLSLETRAKVHAVSWGERGFQEPPEIHQIVDEVHRLAPMPDK